MQSVGEPPAHVGESTARSRSASRDSDLNGAMPLGAADVTPSQYRDLWELTKPEISFLVVISALAGFLLASPSSVDFFVLFMALVGIGLCAGGSGALNHYLERHLDALMRRTSERPLPSGRMSPSAAVAFGVVLTATGVGCLVHFVNALTAVLAVITVLLYLVVYTPLKRRTKYNTLIGAIPGAIPALGGWTAATGSLDPGGWMIFGILFMWQIPHFFSLAWMYRKDYTRAGYAMLPVVEPDGKSTRNQTFGFTLGLVAVSILPFLAGLVGALYLVGALVLGVIFLRPVIAFYQSGSIQDARRVLIGSIIYVPALVALILIDRLISF